MVIACFISEDQCFDFYYAMLQLNLKQYKFKFM